MMGTTMSDHVTEAGAAPTEDGFDIDPGARRLEPATRLLDAARIARLDPEELTPGVTYRVLWAEHRSVAGTMELAAGSELAEHTHRRHAHHVWVVDGSVETMDRNLSRGSYAYVPPGQPHDLVAGPDGATLFYLYLEVADSG